MLKSLGAMARRLLPLVVCALGSASFPSLAQDGQLTRSEVRGLVTKTLARLSKDESYIDRSVREAYANELPEDRLPLAKDLVRSVMRHEKLTGYLTDVLAPLANDAATTESMKSAMVESMVSLQIKGLRRLPPERQEGFVRYLNAMTKSLPPKVCKAIFLGKLDTQKSMIVERWYLARAPMGVFESAMSIYKEAAMAELNGYPAPRTVNAAQADSTEKALTQATRERIARLPEDLVDRINGDLESAEPEDACRYFNYVGAAILDLREPYRSWQLTRFTESLQ